MSFSFIVVDKENALNLNEFISYCSTITTNYEIIYCSGKKVNSNDVTNYCVDINENPEKIINAVTKYATKELLIIIRDVSQYEKCAELIKNYTNSDQVICLKKSYSGFKKFWFNFVKQTIAKILSHNLEPIDYSVVLYGKIATKVLTNVKAPAVLMRTNKWSGIKFIILDIKGGNYKFKYKKRELVWGVSLTGASVISLIALQMAVFKMNMTALIFYYALILMLLFTMFVFASKLILNSYLGDNINESANICLNDINNKN